MVDVRKSFVVLALFALIAGGAYGQITCNLGNPSNPFIRNGGLTELVGDVTMTCTNLGAPLAVNFGTTMNTTVTNRINSDLTLNTTGGVTNNAFVQLFNPSDNTTTTVSGALQPRPETGDVPSTRNRIVFASLTIPTTTAGTTVSIRIAGVRVVAPPVSTTFGSSTVVETVTTNPPVVSIPNPQVVVATVVQALSVDLRNCGNTAAFSAANFAQCVSQPTTAGQGTFNVRFTETGFPNAFKTQAEEGPGATNATQLRAKFINIPAGVRLFVSTTPTFSSQIVGTDPAVFASAAFVEADRLSSSSDRTAQTCGTSVTMAEIPVVNGVAVADWAIVSANPTATDFFTFGVEVVFTANTTAGLPGLTTTTGPSTVQGEFSPISANNFANATSAIPRFSDTPLDAGSAFNIVPCVTNLLFPYVTTAGGFDTGVAISNTSLDQVGTTGQPFTTATQTGTCTAFYFTKPSATQVAPQTTDHAIAPGEVLAFALSQGGVPGATSTVPANFTGYMIVRCNFQFAHGFAFVSDLGAQKLAQGYLALVIPDVSPRLARPFSINQTNVGEILGN